MRRGREERRRGNEALKGNHRWLGYGRQPIYSATATVRATSAELDSRSATFGVRELTVNTNPHIANGWSYTQYGPEHTEQYVRNIFPFSTFSLCFTALNRLHVFSTWHSLTKLRPLGWDSRRPWGWGSWQATVGKPIPQNAMEWQVISGAAVFPFEPMAAPLPRSALLQHPSHLCSCFNRTRKRAQESFNSAAVGAGVDQRSEGLC